ncbi:MAG: hypothetical protein EAZ07_05890 [Cytophagales bacterium]|nr:MAG: hypothetical protein EAZ07_05890 [Cytophagales bacterium]
MPIKIILLYLFTLSIMSSCAVHSGNISTGSSMDGQLKDVVTGEASTRKILGIGGMNKNGLILEAKRDLYNKYKQNKNIKLTNFSVDFKTTYYLFFYSTTLATVSADLYDYNQSITDFPKDIMPPLNGGIVAGDSIIYEFKKFYRGILYSTTKRGKFNIVFKNTNGDLITHKVEQSTIYKTASHSENKIYFGFNIGDTKFIDVYVANLNVKVTKPCKVIGLNNKRLLVSYIKDDGAERWLSIDKNLIKE